jgi:23S rRNA pseudouridine1911/1915/1917 synthase
MRLVDHLKGLGLSNHAAREALSTGKVRLRGCPVADPGREVDPAEIVLDVNAPRVVMGRDPLVLHRDAHLLVVVKPSGMLSVPAPGREEEPNLLSVLGRRFGSLFPVHRLDEETSGLMLVACNPGAQAALKDAFEAHAVERRYLAIVRGALRGDGTVRSVLVRDRGDRLRGSWDGTFTWGGNVQPPRGGPPREESRARGDRPPPPPADGKPAVTHLAPREALPGHTLVEARLETGRTHQVRIHLCELGHPVLGDGLYGPERARRDRRGGRLALHAWRLAFTHPHTHVALSFECPLADDLEARLRELRAPSAPTPPRTTARGPASRPGKR